jgi:hypothetical protein
MGCSLSPVAIRGGTAWSRRSARGGRTTVRIRAQSQLGAASERLCRTAPPLSHCLTGRVEQRQHGATERIGLQTLTSDYLVEFAQLPQRELTLEQTEWDPGVRSCSARSRWTATRTISRCSALSSWTSCTGTSFRRWTGESA